MIRSILTACFCLGVIAVLIWGGGGQMELPSVLRVPEDYSQIQVAIDMAPEGSTILIGPGQYRENLTITKSLTIVGSGPDETVIQGAENPVSSVAAGNTAVNTFITLFLQGQNSHLIQVTIKNLTVQNSLRRGSADYYSAVDIRDNVQLSMGNNRIIGARGIVIKEVNQGTQLSLWRSQITSSFMGIGLYGNGSTTPLQLFMRESGIQLEGGNGYGFGLFMYAAAGTSAMLVGDEIRGASLAISIDQGGYVSLLHSVLHENESGIWLHGGRISIWSSEIRDHKYTGIIMVPFEWGISELELQHSMVKDNKYGVVIQNMCFPNDDGYTTPSSDPWSLERLHVTGRGSTISGNGQDLCPPDYPWPPGFIKNP